MAKKKKIKKAVSFTVPSRNAKFILRSVTTSLANGESLTLNFENGATMDAGNVVSLSIGRPNTSRKRKKK